MPPNPLAGKMNMAIVMRHANAARVVEWQTRQT